MKFKICEKTSGNNMLAPLVHSYFECSKGSELISFTPILLVVPLALYMYIYTYECLV